MTADIRTAAQREAEALFPIVGADVPAINQSRSLRQKAYIKGFLAGAARVTPTREQLVERISGKYFAEHLPGVGEHTEVSVPLATSIADIVLDLIEDLAEGETSESSHP